MTDSQYKPTLRDKIIPWICNWLMKNLTSPTYYGWTNAIMLEGRIAIEKKLASGEPFEIEKSLSSMEKPSDD